MQALKREVPVTQRQRVGRLDRVFLVFLVALIGATVVELALVIDHAIRRSDAKPAVSKRFSQLDVTGLSTYPTTSKDHGIASVAEGSSHYISGTEAGDVASGKPFVRVMNVGTTNYISATEVGDGHIFVDDCKGGLTCTLANSGTDALRIADINGTPVIGYLSDVTDVSFNSTGPRMAVYLAPAGAARFTRVSTHVGNYWVLDQPHRY